MDLSEQQENELLYVGFNQDYGKFATFLRSRITCTTSRRSCRRVFPFVAVIAHTSWGLPRGAPRFDNYHTVIPRPQLSRCCALA